MRLLEAVKILGGWVAACYFAIGYYALAITWLYFGPKYLGDLLEPSWESPPSTLGEGTPKRFFTWVYTRIASQAKALHQSLAGLLLIQE